MNYKIKILKLLFYDKRKEVKGKSLEKSKKDIAEEKISQIDTRINEFDETIKPSHNIMITAEESREDNEKNRKSLL